MIYILAANYRRAQLIAEHYELKSSEWRFLAESTSLWGTHRPDVYIGSDLHTAGRAGKLLDIYRQLAVVDANIKYVVKDGLEY